MGRLPANEPFQHKLERRCSFLDPIQEVREDVAEVMQRWQLLSDGDLVVNSRQHV